jgi:hypothetical protein
MLTSATITHCIMGTLYTIPDNLSTIFFVFTFFTAMSIL